MWMQYSNIWKVQHFTYSTLVLVLQTSKHIHMPLFQIQKNSNRKHLHLTQKRKKIPQIQETINSLSSEKNLP